MHLTSLDFEPKFHNCTHNNQEKSGVQQILFISKNKNNIQDLNSLLFLVCSRLVSDHIGSVASISVAEEDGREASEHGGDADGSLPRYGRQRHEHPSR